ncbi:MAG: SIS domain-containing protein [Candidatus Thermoplasmatota archaeon]|nr:SIS domain-containing protein [Candidatus Thermoplasmatota archaeon]
MYHMEKEIQEQPGAILRTLENSAECIDKIASEIKPETVYLVGSGSSYNCGRIFSYIYEQLTGKKAISCYAMEFASSVKETVGEKDAVFILSQSGESLDAVRAAKGIENIVAVTNTENSTLSKAAKWRILSRAGKENAVPSTKSFTSMLSALTLYAARAGKSKKIERSLFEIPKTLEAALSESGKTAIQTGRRISGSNCLDIIGDGINYPVTLESALKMKETALIHAQGMPVAEYFHGHISMVSEGYPVMLMAAGKEKEETTKRIIERLSGLKAYSPVFSFEGSGLSGLGGASAIELPKVEKLLSPFLSVPIIQLIALNAAIAKGINPDVPRALSKVVR